MIVGFHHAAISTPDLERCVAFYTDIIGYDVAWTFYWNEGSEGADAMTDLQDSAARAAMLKLGDTYLEIFEFMSPKPPSSSQTRPVHKHGITHVSLEVKDIHAEYERMKSAGMLFHSPPISQESGFATYGRDPDGNVVELIEFIR